MIAYFSPFQQVGDFKLLDKVSKYEGMFVFEITEYCDESTPSIHYSINSPEVTLFVDVIDLTIESIACYEECIYKGRNLIGMTIEEFMSHTGEKFYGEIDELDFDDDSVPQYVYEFDDMGLQVWVKGAGGEIVTVIASIPAYDN